VPENDPIGIVIPFYRDVQYLSELITSLVEQSDDNFEVLIIDDSGKGLLNTEAFRRKLDNRFTLWTNESNKGPFVSWNSGIEELFSRRRYSLIAIVHEDDLLHRNYVKNSLSYFARFPEVDVFHTKVKLIGSKGRRSFSIQDAIKSIGTGFQRKKPMMTHSDNGLAKILRRNYVFCPTMIFNTTKFDRIKFDDRWKMVADLDFISNSLIEGRSFLQMPDKNYYYRRHENNLTAELTRTAKRFEEELELYKELDMLCSESGFLKSAKVAKKARIIKLHIAYRMLLALIRFDFGGIRRLMSVFFLNRN
jgi:glycosyltransferase involved in cell wall biosynthesis